MTDSSPDSPKRRGLAPWQVALAAVSIIVAIAGGGLMVYQSIAVPDEPAASAPSHSASDLASGFAPRDSSPDASPSSETPAGDATRTDRAIDTASGAIFRLGFGFFAGFAIGYAMRAFVKITLVVVGVGLIALFGLQYAGLITVDWEQISGGFESFGSWATAQTKDFANFITGYLPSASAGLAGAFVGFRRM